ncbi:unnamed protein product [Rhizoctonia solani]|uniref:BTB domain-containing protein n=1 Tax=Rhizoctonia solani TaxID=456999 RepID=A0A8H3E0A3_9AGAM|nr:unnamed protein product [Rhizoctonia solani]
MDSPLSSVISISNVPPGISGTDHQVPDAPPNQIDPIVVDIGGKQLFDSGDGDMELVFNGTRFETHRYLIKRFKKWSGTNLKPGSTMAVTGAASSEDFRKMLKVLYASILEGPFEFDTSTLVSTLHIATDYEYPALRDYAIRHLEQAELTAIKRIEIARSFGLLSWEKPAYLELCGRDEAITEEEASTLGMAAFVRVAKIREKEQRRRGREIDIEEEATGSEDPKIGNNNAETINWIPLSGDEESPKENIPGPHSRSKKRMKKAKQPGNPELTRSETEIRVETPETKPQPSFIDIPITNNYQPGSWRQGSGAPVGLPVPECSCGYKNGSGLFSPPTRIQCTLPACAVAAFKNLQIRQLAHKKDIADLRSSLNELQSAQKPDLRSEQEIGTSNLPTSSLHEEVQDMLNQLPRARLTN